METAAPNSHEPKAGTCTTWETHQATTDQDGPIHRPPAAPQDNEVGAIFGKKGSGKTTLARSLATKARRVLILDTLGTDYGGGAVVGRSADLDGYYQNVRGGSDFSIIVRPTDQQLVDRFFWHVRRSEDVVAIVEEADRYCSPSTIHPDLAWSINYGRQFGQSIIACARRAHRVHRDLTANADWIVTHQTTEPRDLDYLATYGFDPDRVRQLPRFRWLRVGDTKLF
jgi:hypothetical protein